MAIPRFIERIAQQRGCPPELARDLLADCLATLHETSYKHGTGVSIQTVHAELGGLATWHFVGLVVDAAEDANPGALVDAYARVDPDMATYDGIALQWDAEMGGRKDGNRG